MPAFVYRWLKETSGTGFLRFGHSPNVRAQDGVTEYWLCAGCEQRFNGWETAFANKLFFPIVNDGIRAAQYQDWLLKFAVSVTWRVLSFVSVTKGLDHFSVEMLKEASAAETRWASFLMGSAPHPGAFAQHILILDEIANYTGDELPANINRYLLRSVDFDVVSSKKEAFVYVKLPQVVIVGFICVLPHRRWAGTKIHVARGALGREQCIVSKEFGDYMASKARMMSSKQMEISPAQLEKIDSTATANIERVLNSRSIDAMEADLRLFGSRAFG